MNSFIHTLDLWRCICFLAGLFLLWILTGILKQRHILHESDSRKINHVSVFVGGVLLFGWLPETSARINLYAVCLGIMLMTALVCYCRHILPFCYAYGANTRESDAPNIAFSFWSSWVVSIVALAMVDLLFAQMIVTRTAVLVVGIADGIAEPIGRRYGQHRYRVLSLHGTPSFRSIEGSIAVWVGTLAVMLCFSHVATGLGSWVAAVLLTASIASVVEAISPRGYDNFTLLLVVASLINAFLVAQWIC